MMKTRKLLSILLIIMLNGESYSNVTVLGLNTNQEA